jgi:hypothetical protein
MMICECCGNELAAEVKICPSCGARVGAKPAKAKLPSATTQYGEDAQRSFGESPSYERGYPAQSLLRPAQPLQAGYAPPQPGYGPSYQPPTIYANAVHMTVIPAPVQPTNTEGAMAAEIILSLFGIFGIGWLMSGETTTGIVLVVCSFLVYWPIMLGGTIMTFGFGLICLGPLAIGAIILNAVLLHRRLMHKAAQPYIIMQQSPPIPPMQQFPRQ